jgi:RNA polymerase sigma factor (TIGR02999 family)
LQRIADEFLLRDWRAGGQIPRHEHYGGDQFRVDQSPPNSENRSHFYGVAARLMRQILVDHARYRHARKRAGRKAPLEEVVGLHQERSADLVALDAALNLKALEAIDPRKCRAIELRYFGGLSMEETAQALNVSPIAVRRDLQAAEASLLSRNAKQVGAA